jgi:CDP-diacylglycerol---serine O-phosphatidyltransferase
MAQRDIHPIRYVVPNAITGASMLFGLTSLGNSAAGNYALAGWMIIYAVLSDRIDGLVARSLRATSALGMQLDSFADFLNFGIAPAAAARFTLSKRPMVVDLDRPMLGLGALRCVSPGPLQYNRR